MQAPSHQCLEIIFERLNFFCCRFCNLGTLHIFFSFFENCLYQLLIWQQHFLFFFLPQIKQTTGTLNAYLKKSFLQYSLPSREKHFSVKVHLHSQHWTHLMCHGLSKTLSKNLSRIGFSQLAQWSIVRSYSQPSVRDVCSVSSNVPEASVLTGLCRIQKIQSIEINLNNHITNREIKCSSSVPQDNNPHVATTAPNEKRLTVEINYRKAFLKQNDRLEIIAGPFRWL